MKTRAAAFAILCALAPVVGANLAAAQSPDPHAVDTVKSGEFPAVGKSFDVDFGNQQFRLDFLSETEMRFTSPDAKNTDTVKIIVTRIRPDVFMVYWSRRPGQHALHVQDYGSQVAYTNIFLQDGTASRAKGPLTPAK
jgi:hypothetical protein